MSDEVVEAPVTSAVEQPEKKAINPADMKVGYAVGLTKDGEFFFEVFGVEAGLVQLLGIHEYGRQRIEAITQDRMMRGDRLTHEVGKILGVLNQKLDALQATVAPKKPNDIV